MLGRQGNGCRGGSGLNVKKTRGVLFLVSIYLFIVHRILKVTNCQI